MTFDTRIRLVHHFGDFNSGRIRRVDEISAVWNTASLWRPAISCHIHARRDLAYDFVRDLARDPWKHAIISPTHVIAGLARDLDRDLAQNP